MGGRAYSNTKLHYPLVKRTNRAAERKYKRSLERMRDRETRNRMPEMVGKNIDKPKK